MTSTSPGKPTAHDNANETLPHLSIVVPVYRSAPVLPALAEQLQTALAASEYAGRFELVLVNDCSPDESWSVIECLATAYPFIRGVSLRKNAGQHNATMAGLSFARGMVIVVMDDDLQHPPSAVAELARRIDGGTDVCYTRYQARKHAMWKQWGSWLNDRMAVHILKKPAGLYLSSFKAMHRDIAEQVLLYDGPFTYIDGLIINATNNIDSLDIVHQERHAGESTYNFRRLFSLWLKMATGSSVYPLRAATLSGFILAGLGFGALLLIIIDKLINPGTQPGWASTIVTIVFIGGLQMVFLGIIGEYVGRIYIRVNRAPQFVIRKTTFSRPRLTPSPQATALKPTSEPYRK